jgi:hypothetical protein
MHCSMQHSTNENNKKTSSLNIFTFDLEGKGRFWVRKLYPNMLGIESRVRIRPSE